MWVGMAIWPSYQSFPYPNRFRYQEVDPRGHSFILVAISLVKAAPQGIRNRFEPSRASTDTLDFHRPK